MYLKEFRERISLSQKDFALKLGLSQVTIARYETDKMSPTCKVITKYINIFNANPNYLFLGIEPHVIDFDEVESLKIKSEIIELENKLKLLEGASNMENNIFDFDIEKAMQNILIQLNLKNKGELAEKLDISKNALSNLIARKSLGTIIEKLISKNIIISFDAIIYDIDALYLNERIEEKIKNEIAVLEDKLKYIKKEK